MKKLLSFLLAMIMTFGIYIPKVIYAEEGHYAKNADEVLSLINNLKEGESITIDVDSDMDFSGTKGNTHLRQISIPGSNEVVINNISDGELKFKNVSIDGVEGSSIYFGKGINIYGDVSDENVETAFDNALFVQGISGYGGPKVTINGDVIGTKGSEYETEVIYARSGAEIVVNGNVIGLENTSGILLDSGAGQLGKDTKVTINGNVKAGNNLTGLNSSDENIGYGAYILDGAELTVNGDVIAGNSYYGGRGVIAKTKQGYTKKPTIARINGNVYGGNGVDQTGIYEVPELGLKQSYGYALYSAGNAYIEYSGIIQGGKLGEDNIQIACYQGGDIDYNNGASGEVTVGEYVYTGSDYDKVTYKTHVQDYGWQDWVSNGAMSGTSGESKRLEGIEIDIENSRYSGSIEYKTHVQDYGWQDWVSNGAMSGTSGESKRLEAIEIKLTGEIAEKYDIYYRVHAQDYGWLGWTKNGESAGTEGLSKRLEAIEIRLIEKGGEAPGNIENSFIKEQSSVKYKTHVQNYGWQNWVSDGIMSGTSGESLRLEGIEINLESNLYSGDIEYKTHVQDYGWQDWVSNGVMSGTSGESKRLEAIEIKLTGEIAEKYDIYYRVHAQDYGWLGWTKNGEAAGTEGLSKRLEAIEIRLVSKGGQVPGNTENSFVKM